MWSSRPFDELKAHCILYCIEQYLFVPVYPDLPIPWYDEEKLSINYMLMPSDIPTPKTWVFLDGEGAIEWATYTDHPTYTFRNSYSANSRPMSRWLEIRPGLTGYSGLRCLDFEPDQMDPSFLGMTFAASKRLGLQSANIDFPMDDRRPLVSDIGYRTVRPPPGPRGADDFPGCWDRNLGCLDGQRDLWDTKVKAILEKLTVAEIRANRVFDYRLRSYDYTITGVYAEN